MKIRFVSHKPFPELEVYEESKTLIHVKIDTETRAFRITCGDKRRVFFLSDEVIKKTKITALLNEYSQQLGSIIENKFDIYSGQLEIEGIQFTYKLKDDLLKEINLFEESNYQPVLTCKLDPGQLSSLHTDYLNYLLFSLGWFKFLTKEKAALAQFAEA
jgi:hypothetical protein